MKTKTAGKRHFILGIMLLLLVLFVVPSFSSADPPVPRTVAGRVTYPDGTGVPNGILVRLNHSNTITTTYTNAPALPQLKGSYSATITASINDMVYATALNATHYGVGNTTIVSGTTYINMILNKTRPAETNITITSQQPLNLNLSAPRNLTFDIRIVDAITGQNCNTTITIQNTNIARTTPITKTQGTLNTTTTPKSEFYTILPYDQGTTNATITSICQNNGIKLYDENWKTVTINVIDDVPPQVTPISPGGVSTNRTSQSINFTFQVNDTAVITSCELVVNDTIQDTIFSVQKLVENDIQATLNNGLQNWYVNCTDSNGNEGMSEVRSINISYYPPSVGAVSSYSPVILSAGANTSVSCNATVYDYDGGDTIVSSNASLFHQTALQSDPDNKSTHYSNSSCLVTGVSGLYANVSCGFSLAYYANNGTWTCNMTVVDDVGLQNFNQTSLSVDPLFAFDVSEQVLDYGNITVDATSSEQSLMFTNRGNQQLGLYAYGYGGNDPVTGENYSFFCPSINITIANQRYALSSGVAFNSMIPLNSSLKDTTIVLPKQNSDSEVSDSLFWKLYLAPSQQIVITGQCNGTIVFEAFAS
ncbi:MAG: hypothetical protein ABIA93_00140 [Candidatus Woesearchaeota archaeon]